MKTSKESRNLKRRLQRLQKQYLRAFDIAAMRGTSKTSMLMRDMLEYLLAQQFIESISNGANLTEADWKRAIAELYEE